MKKSHSEEASRVQPIIIGSGKPDKSRLNGSARLLYHGNSDKVNDIVSI